MTLGDFAIIAAVVVWAALLGIAGFEVLGLFGVDGHARLVIASQIPSVAGLALSLVAICTTRRSRRRRRPGYVVGGRS